MTHIYIPTTPRCRKPVLHFEDDNNFSNSPGSLASNKFEARPHSTAPLQYVLCDLPKASNVIHSEITLTESAKRCYRKKEDAKQAKNQPESTLTRHNNLFNTVLTTKNLFDLKTIQDQSNPVLIDHLIWLNNTSPEGTQKSKEKRENWLKGRKAELNNLIEMRRDELKNPRIGKKRIRITNQFKQITSVLNNGDLEIKQLDSVLKSAKKYMAKECRKFQEKQYEHHVIYFSNLLEQTDLRIDRKKQILHYAEDLLNYVHKTYNSLTTQARTAKKLPDLDTIKQHGDSIKNKYIADTKNISELAVQNVGKIVDDYLDQLNSIIKNRTDEIRREEIVKTVIHHFSNATHQLKYTHMTTQELDNLSLKVEKYKKNTDKYFQDKICPDQIKSISESYKQLVFAINVRKKALEMPESDQKKKSDTAETHKEKSAPGASPAVIQKNSAQTSCGSSVAELERVLESGQNGHIAPSPETGTNKKATGTHHSPAEFTAGESDFISKTADIKNNLQNQAMNANQLDDALRDLESLVSKTDKHQSDSGSDLKKRYLSFLNNLFSTDIELEFLADFMDHIAGQHPKPDDTKKTDSRKQHGFQGSTKRHILSKVKSLFSNKGKSPLLPTYMAMANGIFVSRQALKGVQKIDSNLFRTPLSYETKKKITGSDGKLSLNRYTLNFKRQEESSMIETTDFAAITKLFLAQILTQKATKKKQDFSLSDLLDELTQKCTNKDLLTSHDLVTLHFVNILAHAFRVAISNVDPVTKHKLFTGHSLSVCNSDALTKSVSSAIFHIFNSSELPENITGKIAEFMQLAGEKKRSSPMHKMMFKQIPDLMKNLNNQGFKMPQFNTEYDITTLMETENLKLQVQSESKKYELVRELTTACEKERGLE